VADDSPVDRLIASLDASFDASVAREEDEAATDLAFSLRQGRSLREAARGQPLALWTGGGGRVPVTAVGRDYVRAGSLLARPEKVVLVCEGAAPPHLREDALLEVLRRWARRGLEVEVAGSEGVLVGRLTCAAPDHLEIAGRDVRWLVGTGGVKWVRCAREDSEDDL
jgi:hypothetical protein